MRISGVRGISTILSCVIRFRFIVRRASAEEPAARGEEQGQVHHPVEGEGDAQRRGEVDARTRLGQRRAARRGRVDIGRVGADGAEHEDTALRESDRPSGREPDHAEGQGGRDRETGHEPAHLGEGTGRPGGGHARLEQERHHESLEELLVERGDPVPVRRRLARAGGDLADLLRRHDVIVPGARGGIRAEFAALAKRLGIVSRRFANPPLAPLLRARTADLA